MTIKRATQLDDKTRYFEIRNRTRNNFNNLYQIILWNINNNIHMYRVSSSLIVLDNHTINNYNCFEDEYIINICKVIKKLAINNNIRLSMHPDQYVVLSSKRQEVIDNSIKTLETHQQLCNMLGIDILCIHVGSKNNEKILYNTFEDMSDSLKRLLCFENDDKCNNVSKTLAINNTLGTRMMFDYHHDKCCPSEKPLEYYIDDVFDTWKNNKPKCHISSSFDDEKIVRKHHDYVKPQDLYSLIDILNDRDCDIMFECKQKEKSVLYHNKYYL